MGEMIMCAQGWPNALEMRGHICENFFYFLLAPSCDRF